jgi:hypothetical protein
LAKQCRAEGSEPGRQTAEFLDRIRIAERLLAPSVRLFAYVLSSTNQRVEDAASSVRKRWGSGIRSIDLRALEGIEFEFLATSGDPESGKPWLTIAKALLDGDYAAAIRYLIDQNREVMTIRGGAAPWVDIRDDRLNVKLAVDAGALPGKDDLRTLWVHSYFLDSLRAVAQELEP